VDEMEELQIKLECLEGESQRMLLEVDALNNYGNTPIPNYHKMHDILSEWKCIRNAIVEIKDVINCIKSNRKV
jgi:hypothetical protein